MNQSLTSSLNFSVLYNWALVLATLGPVVQSIISLKKVISKDFLNLLVQYNLNFSVFLAHLDEFLSRLDEVQKELLYYPGRQRRLRRGQRP